MAAPDPREPYRERPEWGPQPDGLYRSPIPPKTRSAMAASPSVPADFPGVVTAAPTRAIPHPHRWLSLRSHPDAPSAVEIAAIFNRLGTNYLLVGGHAVGCWSKAPRTTADADFLVFMPHFRRAQEAIAEAFPALRLEEHDAVARFSVATAGGDASEAVDLIRTHDALMLSALENAAQVDAGGVPIRVPCPEAQVALKVAAVRSPNRAHEDALRDAADISSVCAGRALREDLLEALSRTIVSGTDAGLLARVVRTALVGGDVVGACRA
jgi:hypothetical protein